MSYIVYANAKRVETSPIGTLVLGFRTKRNYSARPYLPIAEARGISGAFR